MEPIWVLMGFGMEDAHADQAFFLVCCTYQAREGAAGTRELASYHAGKAIDVLVL